MSFTGKNVLHIITGLNDGGAEAALYRLCCFDTQNHHLVVSLIDRGKYGELLENAGIAVVCLNMPKGAVSLRGLLELWRLIRRFNPDVVQTWMYHADVIGGLTARFAGIRAICWGIRHSDVHPVKTKLSTRLVVWCAARLSTWLPARIACCAHQALRVHQQLGYPPEKITVIANGYDLARFCPDSTLREGVRKALMIGDGMPLLGMVARYDPQKDHANLLDALALLKIQKFDFRCILVGNRLNDANQEIVRLIKHKELDDRIFLLGPRHDMPALMNALDVHILSSSYGEAFPNVLAEAMACATPCVATDVGDAGLIVGDTGWVVPKQNPQALADAIGESLVAWTDRSGWRARQGQCRRRIVENFSIEETVQAYRKLWFECCE